MSIAAVAFCVPGLQLPIEFAMDQLIIFSSAVRNPFLTVFVVIPAKAGIQSVVMPFRIPDPSR